MVEISYDEVVGFGERPLMPTKSPENNDERCAFKYVNYAGFLPPRVQMSIASRVCAQNGEIDMLEEADKWSTSNSCAA